MSLGSVLCSLTAHFWFNGFSLQIDNSRPSPWQVALPLAITSFLTAWVAYGSPMFFETGRRELKAILVICGRGLISTVAAHVAYAVTVLLLAVIFSSTDGCSAILGFVMVFVGAAVIAPQTLAPAIPYALGASLLFVLIWPNSTHRSGGEV
jgi:hypothetical protein